MMSLFSSFDIYFSYIPFMGFFMFSFMLLSKFQILSSKKVLSSEFSALNNFFLSLKPKMYSKFSLMFISSFMLSILIMNFLSVFSFIFPFTSQFGSVFMGGACIWFSFILFNLFENMKGFISHMIPEGSPIYLSSLLFLIEIISNIIRPITLSVRLVANILAGHLLMILLSKLVFFYNILLPSYIFLNMVELFVALIQSYIFCTMISLYFSEVN